jgi:hypothetical protein
MHIAYASQDCAHALVTFSFQGVHSLFDTFANIMIDPLFEIPQWLIFLNADPVSNYTTTSSIAALYRTIAAMRWVIKL